MASPKPVTRPLPKMGSTTTKTSSAATTTTTTTANSSTVDLAQASAAAAASQIAFFRSIPWCAALLSPSSRPNLIVDQAVSRRLHPPPQAVTRDTLVSRTLNAPDALGAYVVFYEPPPSSSSSSAPSHTTEPSSTAQAGVSRPGGEEKQLITSMQALAALGPMLNGWEGVCHGGIVMTLLDEVMGAVFAANRIHGLLPDIPVMTGYLNTRFEKPVRTGPGAVEENKEGDGVVLISSRMVKNEGRKFWVEGDVRGKDGKVLARAEAVFVLLRAKL